MSTTPTSVPTMILTLDPTDAPVDGEILVYDGVTKKWLPRSALEALTVTELRVGTITLRDNAGVLEKSTDGTTWTAV